MLNFSSLKLLFREVWRAVQQLRPAVEAIVLSSSFQRFALANRILGCTTGETCERGECIDKVGDYPFSLRSTNEEF